MIKDDHNNDANIVEYNFMKLRFFFNSKKKKRVDKNLKINSFTVALIVPQR